MTLNNEFKLAIYESPLEPKEKDDLLEIVESTTEMEILEDVYDILESVMGDELDNYFSEGAGWNPVRKFIKKIEEIKDSKPKEYDGPEEIKDFVDKNYDTIMKVAKILEDEPKNLKKPNVLTALLAIIGLIPIIGSLIALAMEIATLSAFIGYLFGMIILCITQALEWFRLNDDQEVYNNLIKIRGALKKVEDKKGLDEKTRNKIKDMIQAINDAEDEISTRVKTTVRESVLEAFIDGEFTAREAVELLCEYR